MTGIVVGLVRWSPGTLVNLMVDEDGDRSMVSVRVLEQRADTGERARIGIGDELSFDDSAPVATLGPEGAAVELPIVGRFPMRAQINARA